ncbi:MAG: PAS domain S-box protein [Magnetococcales bacterium]|nr:PAS domain S-box protein [Magnetococcales bacterium]
MTTPNEKETFSPSSSKSQGRFPLALFVILLILSSLAIWAVYYQQQSLLKKQARFHHQVELDLISSSLRESLIKGDFSSAAVFLNNIARHNQHIASLRAVSWNQAELMHYSRKKKPDNTLRLVERIHLNDGLYLDLYLQLDLSGTERILSYLSRGLVEIFAIFIILLGSAVWFTVKKLALDPMLVQQERENRAILEKANLTLNETNRILEGQMDERLKSEEALQQSEKKYRILMNDSADAILLADPSGYLLEANNQAEKLLGYSQEEFSSLTFHHLHPEGEELERAAAEFQNICEAGQGFLQDGVVIHKDGHQIAVDIKGRAIHFQGQVLIQGIFRDITQRKKTEKAIIENERRYRALFDALNSGVAVYESVGDGADFRFIDFNAAAGKITQTSKDEVVGRLVTEAFPGIRELGLLAVFQQVYQTGTTAYHPASHYQDGRLAMWVENVVYKLPSGEIVAIYDDVTQRKQAELGLKASEAKLRTLFEHSPDIITTVNRAGKVLFRNRSPEKCPLEELPQVHQSRYQRGVQKAFDNGQPDAFQFSTGENAWWEARLVPFSHQGEVDSVMMVCTNVTEKRILQAQALRNARLASLGVLAAGVAHEINNPNNAIQFNLTLLSDMWNDVIPFLKKALIEEGMFYLGGIPADEALTTIPRLYDGSRKSCQRIKHIVGNLKHMSRQDKGELNQEVDLPEVLRGAISILQNQITKWTDQFVMTVPESPIKVRGNALQLEQLFINVILNALQALPDRSRQVLVTASMDDSHEMALVTIQDQGEGISQENLRKVTDPFFTTKADVDGTGLGLSISHTIVRNHEGTMKFESEPNRGTTVTIRLPRMIKEA